MESHRGLAAADDVRQRVDINMLVAGVLSDLALAQSSPQRKWGYKQAASAIRGLDEPLDALLQADGTIRKIPRIGPASTRVIVEVLQTGASAIVERAVEESGRGREVAQRRLWRAHFLSRASVRTMLADDTLPGPRPTDYRGDLQMHSTWSDGSQSLLDIVETAERRGYAYAAVTDHSAGLPIAGGVSLDRFSQQHAEIDRLNDRYAGRVRLLKGVEANIQADGRVDVDIDARARFDIVVAAPHSGLRSPLPQTERMRAAVAAPGVHILGHPRGRMYGSRPGVSADWPVVFADAARIGVAVEIDGDPARQDLDYVLAQQALEAGCLFALDSDAHGVGQWSYADTALAHAKLAGIPRDRIINCWPIEQLLEWAQQRRA